MTAQISAYGRLVADPQTRTTNSGTSMAMARLAVALPCNAADNGEATFWLGIIAFGKQADALAGHVEAIERKAEALCRRQEDVSLKKWLDNQDVCDVLGISKRTLQTYREKGLLPFSRIRHKIFYKPEDVGKLLQSSHYPNTAAL